MESRSSRSYHSTSRRNREPSEYATEHGHTGRRTRAGGYHDSSRSPSEHGRSRSLGREERIRENYARAMEESSDATRPSRGRGRQPPNHGSENHRRADSYHHLNHDSSRAPIHMFEGLYSPMSSPTATTPSSLHRSRTSHQRTMSEKNIHPPPILNVYFTSRGEAIYGFRPYDAHYRPSEHNHYVHSSSHATARERTRSDVGRGRGHSKNENRTHEVLHSESGL